LQYRWLRRWHHDRIKNGQSGLGEGSGVIEADVEPPLALFCVLKDGYTAPDLNEPDDDVHRNDNTAKDLECVLTGCLVGNGARLATAQKSAIGTTPVQRVDEVCPSAYARSKLKPYQSRV